MRQLFMACLCQLALTAGALAQAANVTLADPPTVPVEPKEDEPVSASIHVVSCTQIPIRVERSGTVFNLRYVDDDCPIVPISSAQTVPLGSLVAGTYLLRVIEVSDPAHPRLDDEATFVVPPACPDSLSLQFPQFCLRGGRFSVVVGFTFDPPPSGGFGNGVKLTSDSGAFWFFDDRNYELMVKVLDACGYNGHFWFFAAGLTDVGVDIRVTDYVTHTQRNYSNPIGLPFQPITDTSAFACQ